MNTKIIPYKEKYEPRLIKVRIISVWCGRRDLNPHELLHWNLKPARLPIPPRPHIKLNASSFNSLRPRIVSRASSAVCMCRLATLANTTRTRCVLASPLGGSFRHTCVLNSTHKPQSRTILYNKPRRKSRGFRKNPKTAAKMFSTSLPADGFLPSAGLVYGLRDFEQVK